MIKHQVFFSFEYNKDNWRAATVKEMGSVDNSSTFSSNEWEKVKSQSDIAIKRWINGQMAVRSCVIVLVGETTASRKWIQYEIQRACELNKGIVGVYIHSLKNVLGQQGMKGRNPFDQFQITDGGRLSDHVTCYDPVFSNSQFAYADIKKNLPGLIESAIEQSHSYQLIAK